MSTPTPRTDRAWNIHGDIAEAAWSLARRLERELATDRETSERYRLATLKLDADLAAERVKVRVLRSACESICEEWGRNHDAPFCAGSEMEKLATAALEKTENAQ